MKLNQLLTLWPPFGGDEEAAVPVGLAADTVLRRSAEGANEVLRRNEGDEGS